jgi:hypothetical protein
MVWRNAWRVDPPAATPHDGGTTTGRRDPIFDPWIEHTSVDK